MGSKRKKFLKLSIVFLYLLAFGVGKVEMYEKLSLDFKMLMICIYIFSMRSLSKLLCEFWICNINYYVFTYNTNL